MIIHSHTCFEGAGGGGAMDKACADEAGEGAGRGSNALDAGADTGEPNASKGWVEEELLLMLGEDAKASVGAGGW